MIDNIIIRQVGKDSKYKVWHALTENSFIYIHSGEGEICFNDRIYHIKKGVLCFIPANKQHYTVPISFNTYERSKINISDELLARLISTTDIRPNIIIDSVVYAQIPEAEQKNIDKMWELLTCSQANSVLFCSGFVLQLLSYLYSYRKESVPKLSDFITNAVWYINSHLTEQISIDCLCRYVNISKYYFCHTFKEKIGMSVMKYILNTRLSLAKELLLTYTKSIGEITEQCGFTNISDFCHAFKKDTGLTALQYRKAMKERDIQI